MCPFNFLKKAILFTYHPSFPSFFSLSYKFSPSFSNHIILLKKEALKMSTDNNKITFYVLIFFPKWELHLVRRILSRKDCDGDNCVTCIFGSLALLISCFPPEV